jgi:RNA polymerase sigma factor (sigma-70 family)
LGEPPPELVSFCGEEWPRLVGALRLMTGDVELAKELAQETVARVCRDWDKLARMDAPGAWAHRVAMNLANSHFRRRAVDRRSRAKLAAHGDQSDGTLDGGDVVAVRAAVLALPRRQRMVIVLRYFADLPVREVALVMRCPEGTVKTLTRQAILALRTAGLVDEHESIEEPSTDVS